MINTVCFISDHIKRFLYFMNNKKNVANICLTGPQVAWGDNNGVGPANRRECKGGKSKQTTQIEFFFPSNDELKFFF